MFPIVARQDLSTDTRVLKIAAPEIAAKAQAGQFFILRTDEHGERIPLTFADWDAAAGTVSTVFQMVGKTTRQLGELKVGDVVQDMIGPLGWPSEVEKYGIVVCVGGGIGIAPIYAITRAMHQAGNRTIGIIGARTKDLLFWEDEMRQACDELIVCTDDGSYARKALVTEPLRELLETAPKTGPIQRVVTVGPAIMMKFVARTTAPFQVKTIVSLNSIMVDGTGMCGSCRVEVGGRTQFVCVDGPEFDGHQVDWDLMMARQRIYLEEEKVSLERFLAAQAA
ncbi:MAG: sulfide/dihydroorotate dehydrogenase-like FAD/NAD-binding protein [Chloroflexi bacterium]|nr:sulfide/dihydroorotate dehydrogenase-like FAD/NAD-binding protein [Chloroflexota bacterium]MBU1751012.1 sulfide/dihydroorotate dehydrogenase-like FAD/NAD-binding protein [Chloroflexota bacterium]